MKIEGFLGEETMSRMLEDGKASCLDFVMHSTEEKKTLFLEFCQNAGIEASEDSAVCFMQEAEDNAEI